MVPIQEASYEIWQEAWEQRGVHKGCLKENSMERDHKDNFNMDLRESVLRYRPDLAKDKNQ
jgi:hypothetical protein